MTLGDLMTDPCYRFVHRSVRKGHVPRHCSSIIDPYKGPHGEGYTVTTSCKAYRSRVYVDYYVRVKCAKSSR